MRTMAILSRILTVAIILLACGQANAADVALPQLYITYTGNLNYDEYIPGSMKLTDTDGNVTELPATFKTRGATARKYHMKPSMNMKLRTSDGEEIDENLLGIRKASSFILDAMAIDRICMRNRVCFDIWNEYSHLPYETDFDSRNGTVGKFVEVYINNEYKGIYCLSDKINRKLLDLKKPQVEDDGEVTIRGVLYKHGTNDLGNQETPGMFNDGLVYVVAWHDAWELHEPEDYPFERTWAPLLDAYKNRSSYSYAKEHYYSENLADYTLLIMALCISDNWGNKNKYFSIRNIQKSGDDSRIIVTPWDLDTSLGGEYDGSKYDGNFKQWAMKDILKNCPYPFGACVGQKEFSELLRKRWLEVRNGALSVESVSKRLNDYCSLFMESGAWKRQCDYWNQKSDRPLYVDDLPKEIGLICDWYKNRFQEMDDYFGIDAGVSTIVSTEDRIPVIYNMQGIRVKDMYQPGLYIVDGKKVLVK